MPLSKYSLHPPPPPPAGDGADDQWPPSTVLIDFQAYIADRHNDTTASAKTSDGRHDIQITFCVAQPPCLSYFCVYSPDLPSEDTVFLSEPKLLATEGNLALFRIPVGPSWYGDGSSPDVNHYYIYKASARKNESVLHLLPPPPPFGPYPFHHCDGRIGLVFRSNDSRLGKLTLHPHRKDNPYTIAALVPHESLEPGQFNLVRLRSDEDDWTCKTIALDEQQQQRHKQGNFFKHRITKVITIGGEGGTLGFVDHWRGILLCDVLCYDDDPVLRYIPLPPPRLPLPYLDATPYLYRDIAVIHGRIKFVEFRMKEKRHSRSDYIPAGWAAAAWIKSTACLEEDWQMDCTIEASDITADNNPVHFKFLPELPSNNGGGTPQSTLERLYIAQPTLSLHHDNIVYFMTMVRCFDKKAWTIAVDMKKRALQGVAEFGAQRSFGVCFAYVHSGISQYLALGTKGHLKRPGELLPGSSLKKMPAMFHFTDFVARSDLENMNQDTIESVAGDGDDMDLQ